MLKKCYIYLIVNYLNFRTPLKKGNLTVQLSTSNVLINSATLTLTYVTDITNQTEVSFTTGFFYAAGGNVSPASTKVVFNTTPYTANLTNLTAGKTYQVLPFIQYDGTMVLGEIVNFSTPPQSPVITDFNYYNLNTNSVWIKFLISNPSLVNLTEIGIDYSNNSNFSTYTRKLAIKSAGAYQGFDSVQISSLPPNTTYYIRAYLVYNATTIFSTTQNFRTMETLNLQSLETNMVTVNGGSFTMGYTTKQQQNNGDGFSWDWGSPSTQQVTLSKYKICKYEVTQQLWLDVMGSNPSNFTGDLQRPVETVSWDDCQAFITKLNQLTGKTYRLPTEAEWEYAARGGNNNDSYFYSGSDNADAVAWNIGNSGNSTHIVGNKQANHLGLYDMSGNVWEWCSDWYGNYSSLVVTNPPGYTSGSPVTRSGSWSDPDYFRRISLRHTDPSSLRESNHGLRLVLQTPPSISISVPSAKTTNSATIPINIVNTDSFSLNSGTVAICYSTSNSTPTINDNNFISTNNGTLIGAYNLTLTGLTANTTYYARGYINYLGKIIYSGSVQSFTTSNVVLVKSDNFNSLDNSFWNIASTSTNDIYITNGFMSLNQNVTDKN
ncbi:MAG: formylglycine-generating enzyme family protein, partial [Sediminibacterium sp.]|nr:formylglycine-generating enzyme family protein [Sediminibacterium sp.]